MGGLFLKESWRPAELREWAAGQLPVHSLLGKPWASLRLSLSTSTIRPDKMQAAARSPEPPAARLFSPAACSCRDATPVWTPMSIQDPPGEAPARALTAQSMFPAPTAAYPRGPQVPPASVLASEPRLLLDERGESGAPLTEPCEPNEVAWLALTIGLCPARGTGTALIASFHPFCSPPQLLPGPH